jgi:hypothetical protein
MSVPGTADPRQLAAAVGTSLVVATDAGARRASPTYWQLAEPWVSTVVDQVRALPAGPIRQRCDELLDAPADPAAYRRLCRALAGTAKGLAGSSNGPPAGLFEAAWRAEANSRLGYHVGAQHRSDPVDASRDALCRAPLPTRAARPGGGAVTVLVVVPFRDRDGGPRLRNLLACLRALGDQSMPRDRYRVTVVESDERPRWRSEIEALVDTYLFAPNGGTFNKAWVVNSGAVNSPGAADLVCVLDADILTDRDFLSRNAIRLLRPGIGALLPYRDALYLDGPASDVAVRRRCVDGAATVDPGLLRGFLLRRPFGGCVWVRADLFHRIGGMDERFEGWGGEDDEFVIRLGLWGALDHYRDPLLHLDHPPATAHVVGGVSTNRTDLPPRWPTRPYGVLDRYAVTSHAGS